MPRELLIGLPECSSLVFRCSRDLRRICNTPVRRHRLARPGRADLAGRVVTYREHEVERRSSGLSEFVPALAAQPARLVPACTQHLERHRMDLTVRIAACTVGLKTSVPGAIQDRLGEDAARGIAGAEE